MADINSVIEQITGKFDELFSGLLSTLAVAVVILLLSFITGRVAGRVLARILHELDIDILLKKRGSMMPIEQTIATAVSYAIYFFGILITINHIGLSEIVLYIIIGGALLLIVLATILGIKDFIPNMIAGVVLYYKKLFREGQTIIVNDIEGQVRRIDIIETEIETKQGDHIHIPNQLLIKAQITIRKES